VNKAKLKTYAPQARKDFIAAVTARAHRLGLSDNNGQLQITLAEKSGDLVIIAGQSWPAKISRQRDNLIGLMHKHGFAQTVENVAYTWFNRFAALRYMEIHDYLNHGYRVLSSREGGLPEILGHAPELAQSGDLPGLNQQRAIELKLAGDQDGELYRLTLIAQCNALSNVIPFLFERIDDETELLLPDNLLLTDSVIAKLVKEIPEDDWSQVEIIGWLYQFYISEKKGQVIGKVVKSEDIPAATQLFTPNWIVQYMVQNSIGRLWLMANPTSTLKSEWLYYIEPAEQTPEVQAQLDALIQTRMSEDGGSLNPENLTVLDPACGSGHILVEAYEVLKAIYLERGYQPRNIPRLILENNLYGLDIDDRAAQLAGFALLMKARADDRRLLENPPKLNVSSLQESKGLDAEELAQALSGYAALTQTKITSLLDTFAYAKTFGSLIQVPEELNAQLPVIKEALQQAIYRGDLVEQAMAFDLLPVVRQAQILGMKFDAVVANPPYMGNKGLNDDLRRFREKHPLSKYDLFSMFIEKGTNLAKISGFAAFVVPQSWMFLTTFSGFRRQLIENQTISTLNHFDGELLGIGFKVSAFCFINKKIKKYQSSFQRNIDGDIQIGKVDYDNLNVISGWPLAYWASDEILLAFKNGNSFSEAVKPKAGMLTTNNSLFVRCWWEVDYFKINRFAKNADEATRSKCKWFPYNKGGGHRRWYGNDLFVVNFINNGQEICDYIDNQPNVKVKSNGRVTNRDFYFRKSITWSDIGFSDFSARMQPEGSIFDITGMSAFPDEEIYQFVLAFLCSSLMTRFMSILNPTFHFQAGDMARIPLLEPDTANAKLLKENVSQCISIAQEDWNTQEISHDFKYYGYKGGVNILTDVSILKNNFERYCKDITNYEAKNNLILNRIYGFKSVDESLTNQPNRALLVRNFFNDDGSFNLHTFKAKFAIDTVSYAIGCMMGRYSLDEPGLIYAHSGNVDFNPALYKTFPVDSDGIVPITDELWFEDDAANRIREFLLAVWGAETLDENLAWLAESLGQKANETPEETIRRYLSGSFFKDHLQTYKKRPIYWLFSSGKQGAFQALVYLHRYHEGTLARMRAEYVVPLTGKIQSRIEMLKKDAEVATSNAARNKLNKDIEKLNKKHVELLAYDEKLRHYADLRIQLDLDDGVKVNYGKFGDLLAEVKAVTGGGSDD
jgi:type II restriction/modification system DNA methylase subunit YeeA